MAGGLIDLKRRIKSVQNTQKITKAMGLVATSKFKKVRIRAEKNEPYINKFNEVINTLALSKDAEESIYFNKNKVDTDLYIIITSDSGLCGSYNANVIKKAVEEMENKKVRLITVGEKARSYFRRRGYDTIAEYVEVGDYPVYWDAVEIMKHAIDAYKNGEVKTVNLIYTKFYSPVKQEVEALKLLPLERPKEKVKREFDFEPRASRVLDYIFPKYLNNMLYFAILSSIASEYAMRMNAMDSATKNAQELLSKLQTMYNRLRQSTITQEITEIVSGAEALKD